MSSNSFAMKIESELADYVLLKEITDSSCANKNGKMIVVESKKKKHSIEVQLERYFQDVRQPGRSVVVLEPDGKYKKLGCSRVLFDEAEQKWKIVKVKIIE